MQRRIYDQSTNVAICPLNEEKDVQAAADLVGELFVFSVMLYLNLCPCFNYGQRLTIVSKYKCLNASSVGMSFKGRMLSAPCVILVASTDAKVLSYGSHSVVAD
ncbi:hypothetical protein Patl1_02362 [Pistacia atlantica]|uniref:Uncharacterized protein n=1 Tax=Pistacia atlantica TaxID=434234 RepID=A0ACC1C5N0_9ROSI|nr:hypothetical protein Patl1_02362 [Pistacia atlantica]